MTTYFYSGPSLPPGQVAELAGSSVEWRPPVRHGDLLALDIGPGDQVVIVDGVFHQSAPVRHKEILHLIDQGVLVLGASSMGALRAAELHPFGMVGVGTVYEWYRSGHVVGDDEVVVAHLEDGDYRAVTEPLVNVRFALAEGERQGLVDPHEAASLLELATAVPYTARSWAAIHRQASTVSPRLASALGQLAEAVAADPARWSVKRRDALAALDLVTTRERTSRTSSPVSSDFRWRTTYLQSWRNQHLRMPPGTAEVTLLAVLRWTQIFDPTFDRRLRHYRLRWIAGRRDGPSDRVEQDALDAVASVGLRWEGLSKEAVASWLTDDERERLTEGERLLRIVLRSSVDVAELPSEELRGSVAGLLATSGKAVVAVARSLELNRSVSERQPGRSVAALRRDRLVESLRLEWQLGGVDVPASQLDAHARDRGFGGWRQAVEVYREFHLWAVWRRRAAEDEPNINPG